MHELFTFLNNPYLVVLEESLKSLPGIERIDLLFYNVENSKTELHSVGRTNNKQQAIRLNFTKESLDTLNTFRRKQSNQNWLRIDNIPYSNYKENEIKQDLFSEFDSHVLCLAFPNTTDYSKDLYLFYFRKNTSDFGLSRNDKVLTTSNKAIIGHLLYNSLNAQLNTIKHNQNSLKIINEHTRLILENKNKIKLENIALKNRNKENILQLTEFLINDLNNSDKDIFYLSEDAKDKIGEFSNGIFELKKQLSIAMSLAKTINFGTGVYEHIIKSDYLNFKSSEEIQSKSLSTEILSEENTKHRHSKTFDFLNDMEQAAQLLLKQNWKLTSANVGHKLEKPITAAAISDKLKHHTPKIISLLEQYPAKWPLIRKRFRPLQNVIVKAENKSFERAS
ncbi:MAG: hypothetical protein J7K39_01830 [Bacteroidales bacterium]|nr:hypothetical protein [Bacteroidales bacterium]RLD39478.1 MAG: hypothetical protein DRI74_00675 [Bacteroidota bacterium]